MKTITEKILQNTLCIFVLLMLLASGCIENFVQKGDPIYIKEINDWHSKRIENLKKENGWLNLVGLYWLKQGENKFGSAKDNDLVFPQNAPQYIGSFFLEDSTVTVNINYGIKVFTNGAEVSEMILQHDMSGSPTKLNLDNFNWFIIKRGEKLGVRLRDFNAPMLKSFKGIERFPINDDWRIEADFEAFTNPEKILIPNILGDSDEEEISGILKFKIREKEFTLLPIDSGEKLFIIFADQTNGESTYGAGRFLYSDKPDSSGKVILDFNMAYNPPCVFTKHATCPLPPEQNRLAIKITSGEKTFGDHQ